MKTGRFFIVCALMAFCSGWAGCTARSSLSASVSPAPVSPVKTFPSPAPPAAIPYRGEIPKTIAVFPFENNSVTDPDRFAPLSKGVAAMLMTDLGMSGSKLKVVERKNIQALLQEVEFNQSDMVDESTAIRIGKILGAESIAFGSFIVMDAMMRIDTRIIKVESSELVMAQSVMGDAANPMILVNELAQKIAGAFNMALDAQPRVPGGSDMDASLYFSKGLDALDKGDRTEAERLFAKSVQLDPGFREKVEKFRSEGENAEKETGNPSDAGREQDAEQSSGEKVADDSENSGNVSSDIPHTEHPVSDTPAVKDNSLD